MSIKIYQGFILPQATLEDALVKIQGFRKTIAIQARKDIAKLLAREAIHICDRHAAADLIGSSDIAAADRPLSLARSTVRDRIASIKKTGYRDPCVDFTFEMSLHPVNGDIIGMCFTESRHWFDLWINTPGVADYSYWDSTDAPNNVTDREWELRGIAWQTAMHADPRPAYGGLTASIHSEQPNTPAVEVILASLPDFQDRCRTIALEVLKNQHMRSLVVDLAAQDAQSQWTRAFNQTQIYLRSDAGLAKLKDVETCVRGRLTQNVDEKTLLGWTRP